jgi:hypothetical protein
MNRTRRTLMGSIVPLALLAATTQAWAASWVIQSSPNPSSTENYLNAVTATSSTNAWAVGTFDNSSGKRRTLVEHFDGTSWQKVSSPNVGTVDSELTGVRANSTTDIWAVGEYSDSGLNLHPLIEHFDGTTWTVSSNPDRLGAQFRGVGVSSSTNAWAVGDQPSGAFTEHYDGTSWTIVSASHLGDAQLFGVTTTSSSNAWAVGAYLNGASQRKTLIQHYDGTAWSKVPSPNQGLNLNYLLGVSANSSSDIWAVGEYVSDSSGKLRIMILHYDGASWKVSPHPDKTTDDYLGAVKAVSASDVWGVGAFKDSSGAWKTLIEHFDGTSWTVQTSPNGTGQDNHLAGVASTSSSNSFAVGWDGVLVQSTKTLVLHCAC